MLEQLVDRRDERTEFRREVKLPDVDGDGVELGFEAWQASL